MTGFLATRTYHNEPGREIMVPGHKAIHDESRQETGNVDPWNDCINLRLKSKWS